MTFSIKMVEIQEACQVTLLEKKKDVELVARHQSQIITRNRKMQIGAAMKNVNAKKLRKRHECRHNGMLRNKVNGNSLTKPTKDMPQRCKRRVRRSWRAKRANNRKRTITELCQLNLTKDRKTSQIWNMTHLWTYST